MLHRRSTEYIMIGDRIFLNTRGVKENGESSELIQLLKYFEKTDKSTAVDSDSKRILKLHEKITRIKASEEVGVKFMNAWEEKLLERQDGYEEGLAEGEERGIRIGEQRGKDIGAIEKAEKIAAKMKNRGMSSEEIADMTGLTEGLCGKTRPIHFRGVCTVVNKLFNIVTPDHAYFGQKDGQQLAVIKRMVRDLNMDIEIVGCPIVREEDGLAKSSRNTYLSPEERKAALILSKTVALGKELAKTEKDANKVVEAMKKNIETEPLAKIDYVEAVDALSMAPVEKLEGTCMLAMAVYIGKTRLIDNTLINE